MRANHMSISRFSTPKALSGLSNISVDFKGGGEDQKGAITEVQVAYGGNVIYNSKDDNPGALSRDTIKMFTLPISLKYRIADSSSYGINVDLKLYLPDRSSLVGIRSVDLTFTKKK